jgi:EmrB/QacA subfamily drug resistance transporter
MTPLAYKYQVAIVAVVALFVDLLDMTVVNVALPSLEREFNASAGEVQWTVTAYVLALGIVMPASGWAADYFGAKRTFLFAVGAFTAASALCAVAWSLESMVGFRALQGIGGGLLVPVALATLYRTFPEDERGRASAIFSTPAALAPALGPLLGGALVDQLSWRWVFFVNLPIGALALALGLWVLQEHTEPGAERLDVRGFVLGSAAIVAIVLGLTLIPSESVPAALKAALLSGGAALLAVFVRVELQARAPMVDVRLFARRAFTVGNLIMALASVAFAGMLVLLPLLLQNERTLSALGSGTIIACHAGGIMAAIPVTAWLVEHGGARRTLAVAMIGTAVITATLALVGVEAPLTVFGFMLFVAGLFFGLSVVPLQTAPFDGMPAGELARGTSILSVVRQVGLALGTALLATVLANGLSGATGVERIGAYRVALLAAASIALVAAAIVALLPRTGEKLRAPATGTSRP